MPRKITVQVTGNSPYLGETTDGIFRALPKPTRRTHLRRAWRHLLLALRP